MGRCYGPVVRVAKVFSRASRDSSSADASLFEFYGLGPFTNASLRESCLVCPDRGTTAIA